VAQGIRIFHPARGKYRFLPQFFRRSSSDPSKTTEFPWFLASGKSRPHALANGGRMV
jgi:hypothetical protein